MIELNLTNENVLPAELGGFISESRRPSPQGRVTVFFQGLEKSAPQNRRKRNYMPAVIPDCIDRCMETRS